jgi:hypothetical protein
MSGKKFCTMVMAFGWQENWWRFGSKFSLLNSQVHSPCTLQPLRGFIIVVSLGKPQCAVCGLGEALVGLALVERGSLDNKSTVVSLNLLLGTSGRNFSLCPGGKTRKLYPALRHAVSKTSSHHSTNPPIRKQSLKPVASPAELTTL